MSASVHAPQSETRWAPPRIPAWFLALALGVALSTATSMQLRSLDSSRARASFAVRAEDRLSVLDTNIGLAVSSLRAVGAFFDASDGMSRDQFHALVDPMLREDAAIQALEWVPRVDARKRPAYEADLPRSGQPVPGINERGAAGAVVRAGSRAQYYPVHYVEPLAGNEAAVEFDLGSNAARRAALEAAGKSGEMIATARIKLVQGAGDQFGILMFRPVYRKKGAEHPAHHDRRLGIRRAQHVWWRHPDTGDGSPRENRVALQ